MSSEEERKATKLMNEVKLVTSHVPGSAAAKVTMRNEIRGMFITEGIPSFFVTINPADVYNPVLNVVAGADIDVDNLCPHDISYDAQTKLVASNPVVPAKFFNLWIKKFI
ncbi:hypothetical protein BOTBODRAFT_103342, partial [Botryobasidium botryosum FD-172 SS1]